MRIQDVTNFLLSKKVEESKARPSTCEVAATVHGEAMAMVVLFHGTGVAQGCVQT